MKMSRVLTVILMMSVRVEGNFRGFGLCVDQGLLRVTRVMRVTKLRLMIVRSIIIHFYLCLTYVQVFEWSGQRLEPELHVGRRKFICCQRKCDEFSGVCIGDQSGGCGRV